MMNQHLDGWLLADDSQHGNFSMGLANIELKRGAVSVSSSNGRDDSPSRPLSESEAIPKDQAVELEESIFAFSKAPDEQIGHVAKGGSTGAKVRLLPPTNGNKGELAILLDGKESRIDVGANLGREIGIDDTLFTLKIRDYWPDFRIENGKPSSISDQPNNPAVLVTIRGRGVPVAASPDSHGTGKQMSATGGPPAMPAPGARTARPHECQPARLSPDAQ